MKKLSTTDEAKRTALIGRLREATEKVEAETEKFNAAVSSAFNLLRGAINAYNEVVQEAEEFRSDIDSQMEDYQSERSEAWLDGEAGLNYQSWRDEWAENFEDLEVDEPEAIELPELEHADKLENIPGKMG
jgi:hypothetical protein